MAPSTTAQPRKRCAPGVDFSSSRPDVGGVFATAIIVDEAAAMFDGLCPLASLPPICDEALEATPPRLDAIIDHAFSQEGRVMRWSGETGLPPIPSASLR